MYEINATALHQETS